MDKSTIFVQHFLIEHETMKQITTSNFSFESLRKGDALYVDKTQYLWNLVNNQESIYFLSRPRRFGKSLFLSTLEAFFLNKRELFNGLAIDTLAPDNIWQEWPVIHLDMAQASSFRGLSETQNALDFYLSRVARNLGMEVSEKLTAPETLQLLLDYMHAKMGKNVVVLIDEYDKPILDALHTDYIDKVVGIMQNFYQVVKSNVAIERFVFITGVTKFAHTSLFSGANNPTDISLETEFATMLGYTEQELRNNFSEYIDETAKTIGMDRETMIDKMRLWYDGFRFTSDSAHVFNPVSVGKFFRNKKFLNYWFATGTPTFLVKLMKGNPFQISDFTKEYVDAMDFNSFEVGTIDPIGLAVQTGYLTIKDVCEDQIGISYRYDFPNEEIRISWNQHLMRFITSGNIIADRFSRKFLVPLSKGDVNEMMSQLQSVFAGVTKDHIGKVQEGYYRNMMYMLFTAFGLDVHTEEQVAGGIVDIVVIAYDHAYVFELKVSRDGDEKDVERLLGIGIDQALTNHYADKYRMKANTIHIISVVFEHQHYQLVAWKDIIHR